MLIANRIHLNVNILCSVLITFFLSSCGGDEREYSFSGGSDDIEESGNGIEESDNGSSSEDATASQDDLGDSDSQESQESDETSESIEEPLGDQSEGENTVLYLTEQLKINHRYIIPKAWIESNILPNLSVEDQKVVIGVPKDSADWNRIGLIEDFWASFRLSATADPNEHLSRIKTDTTDETVTVGSITDASYDYALEWDGAHLHVIASTASDFDVQPSISNGGTFTRVASYLNFSSTHDKVNQELDVVIAFKGQEGITIPGTELYQERIPWSERTILVGEASNGNGQFGLVTSTNYDATGQHAPGTLSFFHPEITAGNTYTYIYGPWMEAGDYVEFRLASDNTTVYTTGITTFDHTQSGDPGRNGTDGYKGFTFAVPADAPDLRAYFFNSYHRGGWDGGREVTIIK